LTTLDDVQLKSSDWGQRYPGAYSFHDGNGAALASTTFGDIIAAKGCCCTKLSFDGDAGVRVVDAAGKVVVSCVL
jgi:hypothetical protein